jgi:tRNA G18 (ribose-2'-O)-methylase SpoU
MSDYFGVGIECCKTEVNYGSLYRTAHILGASFVFMIGQRFKKQSSDTSKSWLNLPVYSYESFKDFYKNLPYGCQLIGVELDNKAIALESFNHPKRACYLLGAEDHGLSKDALSNCHELIKLRGNWSMNVAIAGSIVIYHRIMQLNKDNH